MAPTPPPPRPSLAAPPTRPSERLVEYPSSSSPCCSSPPSSLLLSPSRATSSASAPSHQSSRRATSATCWLAVLLLAAACLLAAPQATAADGEGEYVQTVLLGFMLPYPTGDGAVPPRLADEWISAVHVALDVLGPQYKEWFVIQPKIRDSNCSADSAEKAAMNLVNDGVVGVVGPACSEAVQGANRVFAPYNVPFISFAATADVFELDRYKSFFRTVFPDRFQAKAIASTAEYLKWSKLYVFHSNETYGNSLLKNIKSAVGTKTEVVPVTLPYPPPPPMSTEAYAPYLADPATGRPYVASKTSGAVVATLPNAAEGLWRAAAEKGMLDYPWWYLAADGAVAFDLVGTGSDSAVIASELQGEIGIGPFRGSQDGGGVPQFQQFKEYWTQQAHEAYPGLLTLNLEPKFSQPRAYVLNLIDAVWTFFEASKTILTVRNQPEVTRRQLLNCLRGFPTECVRFDGASGRVAYFKSGERDDIPTYALVNLQGIVWQDKALWREADGLMWESSETDLARPGPIPEGETGDRQTEAASYNAPSPSDVTAQESAETKNAGAAPYASTTTTTATAQSTSGSSGAEPWTVAAVVVLSVTLLLVTIAAVVFWLRSRRARHPQHQQFTRMI